MAIVKGKVKRMPVESEGNAVLLVVVNSAGPYWHHSIVNETVINALMHFGMPFRMLDLAKERISIQAVKNCAAVVLAQNLTGGDLDDHESGIIESAVKEQGIGFVSFDNDIRIFKTPLTGMFGFERINPHPYATDMIRISKNDHFITQMQQESEFHTFDRMLTCVSAEKWAEGTIPLAEGILGKEQLIRTRHVTPYSAFEPVNHPLLFVREHGKGRAVQFTINPRVWKKGYYGHARGIDDLFWRALIWSVKKPFAANLIPPFVSMSIEDCSGRYDFSYVDICNKYGIRPMPGLMTKTVSDTRLPIIRGHVSEGKAEYGTHGLDYHNLLYGDYGKGPYTRDEYEKIFAFEDDFWRRAGFDPAPVNRPHLGEWYEECLPFLKKRGRMFFSPGFQISVLKLDQNYFEGLWPYELSTCCYDFLPDDNEFYVFAAGLERGLEDFLTGCTPILAESRLLDMDKSVRNGIKHMTHGLKSGFYGIARFHEQKFSVVSLAKWDEMLKGIMDGVNKWEYMSVMVTDIAKYIKNRESISIESSAVLNSKIMLKTEGTASSPVMISIFEERDGDIVRRFVTLDKHDIQNVII